MLPLEGRKRRFGDRKDGFRVRNIEPMNRIEPFVMYEKSDAWVLFEDKVDITHVQEFVREHRRTDMPDLTLYHVLFAAFIRAISQYPQINRFAIGHRIYARNELKFSMVVKKGEGVDAERTIIMPRFHLDATLPEVKDAIEQEIAKVDMETKAVEEGGKTGFDFLEVALGKIPTQLLRFVFFLLRRLDYHGWLPKALTDLSPFHTSVFITNMGSFGMGSVYHHIYNFGTLSVFGALGKKQIEYVPQKDGSTRKKVFINMKFVVDERITDGFVFGMGIHEALMCFMKPEKLMERPEKVVQDEIDKK